MIKNYLKIAWRNITKNKFSSFINMGGLSIGMAMTLLAWYFMHNWLENYQYRTEISWWILAVAACGALAITILTVSFQAIKAAIANPVKSLRTE